MQNSLMYRDVLTLIFSNKQNHEYFKKYYGKTRNYQIMLRDYKKLETETLNIQPKHVSTCEKAY